MKIFLKTEDEIDLMRKANQLVGATLAELGRNIKPGVTTLQLDKIAEEFIRDHGAVPTSMISSSDNRLMCFTRARIELP